MSHTPGPWVVGPMSGEWSDDAGEMDYTKGYVSSIQGPDQGQGYPVTICGTCDGCNPIKPDDARLISAAPDLLEALEMLADAERDRIADGGEGFITTIARAKVSMALTKARGT